MFPASMCSNPSQDIPLVVGVIGNCETGVTGVIEDESKAGVSGIESSCDPASGEDVSLLKGFSELEVSSFRSNIPKDATLCRIRQVFLL